MEPEPAGDDGTDCVWHIVAGQDEIGPGQMTAREIGDLQIAVYNVDGRFYATDNICTHEYALLTDGWLEDTVVECPLHAGQFDICTGKAVCAPAEVDLRTYAVRRVGGNIEVLLPSRDPESSAG